MTVFVRFGSLIGKGLGSGQLIAVSFVRLFDCSKNIFGKKQTSIIPLMGELYIIFMCVFILVGFYVDSAFQATQPFTPSPGKKSTKVA